MTGETGIARASTGLADGEWHRLHPASPLLRGGLAFLAVLGIVIANLRERLAEFLIPVFSPDADDAFDTGFGDWRNDWANDPIGGIVSHGWLGWALLGLVVVLVAIIAGFWLSWRFHSFRITDEAVEVRSGILFRSHRSARLDRIQGINVTRPLFARLFGAAKLDVSVAGQSGNVQLAYLGSALADGLRADILRLSSGARAARAAAGAGGARGPGAAGPGAAAGLSAAADADATTDAAGHAGTEASARSRTADLLNRRVDEFLAPELDPALAPPESVVHLPIGRVIGSTLLGGWTIWLILMIALIVAGTINGWFWIWFSIVPGVIGLASYAWSQITKSLRYSIAGTPDGVRIGHGLLSTANRTIPPGRVHAIEASQWILWRPFGWWSVRVNLAGQSISANAESQTRTIVLPVGTADDVRRVLALMLPGEPGALDALVPAGLTGRGDDGGFEPAPRRAAWLHPFSWRRIGWAEREGVAALRRGVLSRSLVLVPLARLQSVAVSDGPLRRMLRLATIRLHTVMGPITPRVPVLDAVAAERAWAHLAGEAIVRAAGDTSHHWGLAAIGAADPARSSEAEVGEAGVGEAGVGEAGAGEAAVGEAGVSGA
ncbi:PH domain-containing protein [Agromyces intestinalis]|uniref:PH domain-containing protein n=1 Tax=Agromyces intestinalis TaxID=2592652 RepID=A0A5C1YHJ5_9MICO|nr:PH domain-containing protein [Agromyces intestinalis]QEO15078.1 PH domain-containing protein [Agromyces intestinalis]